MASELGLGSVATTAQRDGELGTGFGIGPSGSNWISPDGSEAKTLRSAQDRPSRACKRI